MDTSIILGCLKWLFPATFGSCLAVYYKAKEIGWVNIPKEEKIKTLFVGLGAVITGVFVAYILGGMIVEFWEMDATTKAVLGIYAISGFSGVKLVDAIAKNTDKWVDKLIETVTTILDKLLDKINRWF